MSPVSIAAPHAAASAGASSGPVALPEWVVSVALDRMRVEQTAEPVDRALRVGAPTFGPCRVHGWDHTLHSACAPAPFPLCVLFGGFLVDRHAVSSESDATHMNDAGLVLLAYRRWGERVFEHLDGAFLAAVWDGGEGRLLLGRDGVGRHPAYYAVQSRTLWFSPNILALARVPNLRTQPDRMSIARRIVFQPPAAGRTCFSGIHRVQPAHFVTFEPDHTGERRYWSLLPGHEEPWLPGAEVVERYEALLERAVDRCLDLGAGGVLLSGGTDSVSVAALAAARARRRGLPVPAACCGKTPPGYDRGPDEDMQDRVAGVLGMPGLSGHSLDWLGGRDLLSASLSYTPLLPAPTTAYWMGEFLGFYRRIVDRGIHTVMSGSGGDEWMGVHESWFIDLVQRGDVRRMLRFARALSRGRGASLPRTMAYLLGYWALRYPAAGYTEKTAPGYWRRRRRAGLRAALPVWLGSMDELVDDVLADGSEPRVPPPDAPRGERWYRHTVARLYRNPHMHHELERRYQLSHALGLRMVSPFQDREVVHFFNRVSPDTLLQAGRTKGLLRRIIDRHVGDAAVAAHPKLERGGRSYLDDQLRAHIGTYVASADLAPLRELELVDVDRLMKRVRDPSALTAPECARIFGVLSAAGWLACNF